MRRNAIIVGVLLFALSWVGLATAQSQSIEPLPYIYRIDIKGCTFEPLIRRQTGFRVAGLTGIVTALHGVADCKTISAVTDNGQEIYTDLVIQQVDIARDVALLSSPILDDLSADGLVASSLSTAEILTSTLRVVGYPLGLDKQDTDVIESIRGLESLLDVLPPAEVPFAFVKRGSPDINIQILNVQAQMLPGHSGAPVIDAQNGIVAIGDGGLRGGNVGRSWVIPWWDVSLQSINDERTRKQLNELASKDISALGFSSTYPGWATLFNQSEFQGNPSLCLAVWDCRTSQIAGLLFGEPLSDRLCKYIFRVLDAETDLPIGQANVTVLLGNDQRPGYTLKDGTIASSIPCRENNPTIEVYVTKGGYESDSKTLTLVGEMETVYLIPSPVLGEVQEPLPATIDQLSTVKVLITMTGVGFASESQTSEARRQQSALLAAQKDANRNFVLWRDGADLEAVTIVDQGEVQTDRIREEIDGTLVRSGTIIEQSYDDATRMAQVTVEYVVEVPE